MIERFRQFAAEQHLFPDEGTVLLAVSGGRDSVCMAHLMHCCGRPFAIAHCNFHLRPGDCDRDEQFVADLAARLGVPFHTEGFDTRAYAAAHSMSIEEAARHLRYSWFADVCARHGYHCLATAHHRDDSIETFFLNLFRGTGIAGLHGILPLSTLRSPHSALTVVRPLLCFSRADIDAYVEKHSLSYVDDFTNAELDAQRNRIRHQLMPLLRTLYPSVDATMTDNMSRLRDAELMMKAYVSSLRSGFVHPVSPRVPVEGLVIEAIDIDALRAKLSSSSTLVEGREGAVLFELLRPYNFNAAQVAEMLRAFEAPRTGARWDSATHTAAIDRGRLLLAAHLDHDVPAVSTNFIDPASLGPLDLLTMHSLGEKRILIDADVDLCHADIMLGEHLDRASRLYLRHWRPGDRFCPFGMGGRERLVSDVLKDLKLSVIEKEHVYVLTDADGNIVWLVGLRADHRYRVSEGTTHILEITV